MKLSKTGTVTINKANCRFNEAGRWSVSRGGIFIGEVDTLAEVPGLIEKREAAIRQRLAEVTAEAERRRIEREAERKAIASATKPAD